MNSARDGGGVGSSTTRDFEDHLELTINANVIQFLASLGFLESRFIAK